MFFVEVQMTSFIQIFKNPYAPSPRVREFFSTEPTCYGEPVRKNNDRTIQDHFIRLDENAKKIIFLQGIYNEYCEFQNPDILKRLVNDAIFELDKIAYGGSAHSKQSKRNFNKSSDAVMLLYKTAQPLRDLVKNNPAHPEYAVYEIEQKIVFYLEHLVHIANERKQRNTSCKVSLEEGTQPKSMSSQHLAKLAYKEFFIDYQNFRSAYLSLHPESSLPAELEQVYFSLLESKAHYDEKMAERKAKIAQAKKARQDERLATIDETSQSNESNPADATLHAGSDEFEG